MEAKDKTEDVERPAYEAPAVIDYGSLLELTLHGGIVNSDQPMGANNTAFPPS